MRRNASESSDRNSDALLKEEINARTKGAMKEHGESHAERLTMECVKARTKVITLSIIEMSSCCAKHCLCCEFCLKSASVRELALEMADIS